MPREFVAASVQCVQFAGNIFSAYPMTVAGWARATTVAALQEVFSQGDSQPANTAAISIGFSATGAPRAVISNSGTSGVATAGAVATNGTWCHITGVFTNATSRDCYINGGNKGSNATNLAFPTTTRTAIGRRERDTDDNYLTGAVAEVGCWSVALDADEIVALSKGFCPLLIRPASLLAYWPLFGNDSPEPDRWKNRSNMSLVAAPTKSTDGVRIIYPE